MKNRVQMVGNVGNTPELIALTNDNAIGKFNLAIHENWQDEKGEWQQKTYWHQVVAWSKMAKRIAANISKGDKIAIEGRLMSRVYEDKEGKKHGLTEIVLSNFELIKTPAKVPLKPKAKKAAKMAA